MPEPLRYYGSDQLHSCHQQAMEILGLGNQTLVRVPSKSDLSMNVDVLRSLVAQHRTEGLKPACVIATAGTVNTGAIDDLESIADFCEEQGLSFHVDGCIGAFIEQSTQLRLLFPTNINIVCFLFDPGGRSKDELTALNTEIMLRLQEEGTAVLSDTTVHGSHCLRAAINNHRTLPEDLHLLVAETLRIGNSLIGDG